MFCMMEAMEGGFCLVEMLEVLDVMRSMLYAPPYAGGSGR